MPSISAGGSSSIGGAISAAASAVAAAAGSAGASAAGSAGVAAAAKKAAPPAPSGPINRDLAFPGTFFEVKVPALEGKVQVGFFTQVQGVSAQVDVLEYPEGGRNDMIHKLPSRLKQGNVTLKRGMTKEPALLAWLQKSVVKAEPTNMSLTLYNSAGEKVQAWSFAGAYPVKWTASDANAGGNEIMTETLEIAHMGITSA
jgi:phage tail-like protein